MAVTSDTRNPMWSILMASLCWLFHIKHSINHVQESQDLKVHPLVLIWNVLNDQGMCIVALKLPFLQAFVSKCKIPFTL